MFSAISFASVALQVFMETAMQILIHENSLFFDVCGGREGGEYQL